MKRLSVLFPFRRSRSGLQRAIALLLCSAALLTTLPPQAQAQTFAERIQQLFTRRREVDRASGRARGGAIRSGCQISQLESDRPLMALIPEGNLGKTAEAHPTFWFYSPFTTSNERLTALFTLLDENHNPILQNLSIPVTLPESPGLVSFRLPESEAALQAGDRYNWYFTIACELASGEMQDLTEVHGWVQRVENADELSQQLSTTSNADTYQIAVENDLWYETVTQLSENRTTYADDWAFFLSLFGLQDVASNSVTELQPIPQASNPTAPLQ